MVDEDDRLIGQWNAGELRIALGDRLIDDGEGVRGGRQTEQPDEGEAQCRCEPVDASILKMSHG